MSADHDTMIARAGELARARFASGANCAESLIRAVPEALGDDSLRLPEAIGTGWTAGIGEGGCLCGALAASVMILGAQTDAQPGAPAARRSRSVEAAGEMREAFRDEFGSTCCRVLRKGMVPGTPECKARCGAITGRTAEMLTAAVIERGATPVPALRRIAGRDLVNAVPAALGLAAVAIAGFAIAAFLTGGRVTLPVGAGFVAVSVLAALVWTLWRMSGRGAR